jgi:hypothetical protein
VSRYGRARLNRAPAQSEAQATDYSATRTPEALYYCPRVVADLKTKISHRFVRDGSRED